MDIIPKDKAIAALSEINKLRHEWNQKTVAPMTKKSFGIFREVESRSVIRSCAIELASAIERAYEILNNG